MFSTVCWPIRKNIHNPCQVEVVFQFLVIDQFHFVYQGSHYSNHKQNEEKLHLHKSLKYFWKNQVDLFWLWWIYLESILTPDSYPFGVFLWNMSCTGHWPDDIAAKASPFRCHCESDSFPDLKKRISFISFSFCLSVTLRRSNVLRASRSKNIPTKVTQRLVSLWSVNCLVPSWK